MASIGFGPYASRNAFQGSAMMSAPGGNRNGGSGDMQSKQQNQSSQGQYFQNQPLVNALSGSAGGLANDAAGNYMSFLQNPTNHPYFANALSGLLGALQPSENMARQGLNDQFRAAGNTSSSTYGQKAMGLESEFMRNRGAMASQLLTTMFPQISQALFAPIGQADSLINALKMSQQASQSSGESYFDPKRQQGAGSAPQFTGFQSGGSAFGFGGGRVQSSPQGGIFQTGPANTIPMTQGSGGSYITPDLGSGSGFDWNSGGMDDGWY
jgi:hypothetical protein